MKKSAFIFPGQSSQRIGMLGELFRESELVRHTFEEASDAIGYDVSKVCLEGGQELLQDISISAPAIVTASTAAFRHLQNQLQLSPAVMAGHSLGEYAALTCAGVFALEQVLPLVAFRSKLAQRVMAEHEGVMTVILKIKSLEIEELCKQMCKRGRKVWVSCLNAEKQVCVGGRESDVEALEQKVLRMGGSFHRIKGNAPFHTPLMMDVVNELGDFLKSCSIAAPQFPVIANVSTRPYTEYTVIENLLLQLQYPVRWSQTIAYIKRQNLNTFIELGSGQILTRLLKSEEEAVEAFNYETAADRSRLAASLGQLEEVGA